LEEIDQLAVYYLDVGQGNSIFIQLPNSETVLIDGGTRSNGNIVHNLRLVDWQMGSKGFDWAYKFDELGDVAIGLVNLDH